MKRFLRRTLFMLVPATLMALVLWVPASTSDLGLQNVTLSCPDGTLLNLELDVTALTALADAVAAINLYPAGDPPLACSLSQSSASSAPTVLRRLLALLTPNEAAAAGGNPQHDYVVGGGQLVLFGACHNNFALSAHVDNNAPTTPPQPGIGGTFNTGVEPDPVCGASGHLDSKVDCLQVTSPNTADLTAVVTKSSGIFASIVPGTEISVSALDSGMPGGTGDMLGESMTSSPCNFSSSPTHTI